VRRPGAAWALAATLAGVIVAGACSSAGVAIGASPSIQREEFLRPRTGTISDVAPGVRRMHILEREGPWTIDVVTVDLRQCGCEFRQVRARDSVAGREKVTSMVARQKEGAEAVLAAVNADFFNLQTGESENNVVVGGEWWKGNRGTDNTRSQFGVNADGKPMIDRFTLHGTAIRRRAAFPVTAVNFFPRTGEHAILFTPRYGRTPIDTARPRTDLFLRRVAARGDTALFLQVGGPLKTPGGTPIPFDGAILTVVGPRATIVGNFVDGDTIRVVLRAAGSRGDGPRVSPQLLIGGWPRILRAGRNVAVDAPWDEATGSSNAEVRHPRSAVGFNRDSTQVFIVTVDGRQASSVGMTLIELADLMKDLGAWDALNFDGGGSTTLVVKGQIVNKPSDSVGEREVANALLVVRRR
jgi:hypothetical protein